MITRHTHPEDLAHTTGIVAVSALGVSLMALVAGLAVVSSQETPVGPVFSESDVAVVTTIG